MEQDTEATAGGKGRSGSETRKRGHVLSVRLSAEEYAELEAEAKRTGHTVGAYVRGRITKRAPKRPIGEVQVITRLQGEMNKVGSNIHQLLKLVRFGETPTGDEIRAAFTGYREVIAAILVTLGRGKP
jgi:hypothetical protein